MRTPALLFVPLFAAVVVAGLTFAGRTPSTAAPSSDTGAAEDHEALEEAMYGLKDHLKKLSRALTPEGRDAALSELTEMQRIVLEAKSLTPSNLEEVPEGARAEHRVEFRKEMLTLLAELVALELDVVEGDNEKALERVRGPLLDIRNRSHDKFQKE